MKSEVLDLKVLDWFGVDVSIHLAGIRIVRGFREWTVFPEWESAPGYKAETLGMAISIAQNLRLERDRKLEGIQG